MAEGTVTLSLDQYETMQDQIRELNIVKRELENEKAKTWKIFGAFFEPKRTVESLIENNTFERKRHFRLRYNNPTTTINFVEDPFIPLDNETKGMIIRTLIERHISDVINGIDFKEVELNKW